MTDEAETATAVRRKDILVVEDDPAMRRVLVQALVAQGAKYRVMAVDNGADAEDRILSDPPDLVIMDVMLPYKSGVDICVELSADPRRKKVLILLITSLTDKSSMSEIQWKELTRADAFLPKPFAINELVSQVGGMLQV
jgi:twitching motility two-component system response regulator PilH